MLNGLSALSSGLVLVFAFVIAQAHPMIGGGADRSFVVAAEQAGNMEIAEGRIAEMRGTTARVRALGARMVHDHTLAGDRLVAIARAQELPVTTSLGVAGAAQLEHLRAISGRAFDAAYVRGNVPDHEQAIALLDREASMGHDAALRAWCRRTLPTLRVHLSLFEAARSAVNG
jgi:putative membrane protein